MRKYVPVLSILVVGFGFGILAHQVASSLALQLPGGDSTATDPSAPAATELVSLSANTTAPDGAMATGTPATPPADAAKPADVATPAPTRPEDLLAVIRDNPGTPQAAEAVSRLAAIYREEGKERKALTVELEGGNAETRQGIAAQIDTLNQRMFDSNTALSPAETYVVNPGDSLSKIGRQYQIAPQLIMKLNGLKNDLIRVGQSLKVVKGPFWVKVDKSDFRLTVYLGDEAFKEYPIGLGIDGSTPLGEYVVQSKVSKPTWYDQGAAYDFGDPSNPLGTRWIAFKGPYGIHGTWEDDSIGKEKSRGCVRMYNRDVEEVFDLLVTDCSKIVIEK
jgi:lipoprotein-anchoring transpeptidase ErfK/SrfK